MIDAHLTLIWLWLCHYRITKAYAADLRNKIAVFKDETQTQKAIFLTMITTFGLHKNEHSTALVQHEMTMDTLFEQGRSAN